MFQIRPLKTARGVAPHAHSCKSLSMTTSGAVSGACINRTEFNKGRHAKKITRHLHTCSPIWEHGQRSVTDLLHAQPGWVTAAPRKLSELANKLLQQPLCMDGIRIRAGVASAASLLIGSRVPLPICRNPYPSINPSMCLPLLV
jgi:hypothetical protein